MFAFLQEAGSHLNNSCTLDSQQTDFQVVREQWGNDLITSWNKHKWSQMPSRIGNKLAKLLGANEGEIIACDSLSINVFKAMSAALDMQEGSGRNLVVSGMPMIC